MKTATLMLIAGVMATPALGADYQVQMLNKGSDGAPMMFEPAYLAIESGDTVTFAATERAHNSEAIAGMMPEGAELWKARINEEITVTFEVPGLYGYKCLPHYPLGMVGLIQVGAETPNLVEAQTVKHPGKAAQRMTELFKQVSKAAQ